MEPIRTTFGAFGMTESPATAPLPGDGDSPQKPKSPSPDFSRPPQPTQTKDLRTS